MACSQSDYYRWWQTSIKAILAIVQNNKVNIPLIGIAKNPDRVIVGVEGFPNLFLKNDSKILNIIRLLRDESHRFARKYHLFLRSKDFCYNITT